MHPITITDKALQLLSLRRRQLPPMPIDRHHYIVKNDLLQVSRSVHRLHRPEFSLLAFRLAAATLGRGDHVNREVPDILRLSDRLDPVGSDSVAILHRRALENETNVVAADGLVVLIHCGVLLEEVLEVLNVDQRDWTMKRLGHEGVPLRVLPAQELDDDAADA